MLLKSEYMQDSFKSDTRTVAQPTLNLGLIRSSLTPLPPLPEQKRIVAKVDELMMHCNELLANIRTSEALKVELAESVVHHASAS